MATPSPRSSQLHIVRVAGALRECVPTASRLLAMKRPDTFICICKPNIGEASRRMAFSRTMLELDDYWEKVIEVIRLSDWYHAQKPDGVDGEIWENRVAMLDAILYRPD